jgi:hypothetical protein
MNILALILCIICIIVCCGSFGYFASQGTDFGSIFNNLLKKLGINK